MQSNPVLTQIDGLSHVTATAGDLTIDDDRSLSDAEQRVRRQVAAPERARCVTRPSLKPQS